MTAPSPTRPVVPIPTRDLPPAPGITVVEGGVDVSVYAGHATAVDLCLFEPDDPEGLTERRIPLIERAHGWWFGFVPGIGVGQRYAFRVDGDWAPEDGQRHNADKLLLDPYAKALEGSVTWGKPIYGHKVDSTGTGDGAIRSTYDSAGSMPRCVVVNDEFDWEGDVAPQIPRTDTVIYETHVKDLTILSPDVPAELRGTYAGLANPATIDRLQRLGVTTVELLPIHAYTTEPEVVRRGLTNHWGYNTLGFFAPEPRLAAATDPQGVVAEVKGMVKLLHRAGLEVILDVVYNHTAEQSVTGPTLSWRGLDSRAYYRLDERGRDVDVTGCGNTLDLRHPVVTRMVLDSMRHWVTEYHVDGFRFDLAVALARGRGDDYDPDHPLLVAIRADPVLCNVKLIAEPWDLGVHGWRTGQFPPPFSEWNDRFRDTMRTFWLEDVRWASLGNGTHGVRDLATRLAGSRDLFGSRDRGPVASINYVTAHDGFTLADLTAYDTKHNEANLEANTDGAPYNHSWNHGVEGPTQDPALLAMRRRSIRNLLGSLILSAGTPMLRAGDEIGHSTDGNNNPYCQDNAMNWLSWDLEEWQEDLVATVGRLTRIRQELPVLRQRTWALGRSVHEDGSLDLEWYAADGLRMDEEWLDPHTRTLQMYLNGAWLDTQSALLILHGGPADIDAVLPAPPGGTAYRLLWDSAWDRPQEPGPVIHPLTSVRVPATSMRIYSAEDLT